MNINYRIVIIFLAIWASLLLVAFNKHIRREPNTYHSEIYADKAGYYVYLPATFIYNWQGNALPDSISIKTGDGFTVIDNIIVTKYTMGTAVMMAPFWCINHYFIANPRDGFSFSYTLVSSVASTFYVLLGLFISYACFRKYTPSIISLFITISVFISTNLFYYTIIENGMSHSFSFFWFSILLFTILNVKQHIHITVQDTLLLGISVGFIILIRPINCIFCLPYFLILVIDNHNLKNTLKDLLLSTKSIVLYAIPIILFSPQLWYYKLISNISPAYNGEGFPYLTHPKIPEVLFAPNNGLFLYVPILFFILIYALINTKNRAFCISIFALFCMVIYTYGSWWSYELGCAFGHRSMVEFYSLLFLPLSSMNLSKKIKISFIFIAILCSLYTLKLSLTYDSCFQGSTDWDWNAYIPLLFSNIK